MYRCFECDAPAQSNCACFTQMEHPHGDVVKEDPIMVDGVEFRGNSLVKINIASGEDATHLQYPVEYA